MSLAVPSPNALFSRLIRRNWSDEEVRKYLGNYRSAWLSHAADDRFRYNAASGGTTSALFAHLLETDRIDGALVCQTVLEDGHVRARFRIARTRDEIIAAQGSRYVSVNFAGEALPLIQSFTGRLAIACLPCHIDVMRRRMEKDSSIRDKVACLIGLVCGHISDPPLIDALTRSLEKKAGSPLAKYVFRRGHWRGRLEAEFEDGSRVDHPYSRYGLYQNLYFWSEKKCFQCHDHFAYNADISVGDVWSFHLKDDPIKHSGVLVRTARGQAFFADAVDAGVIIAQPFSATEILEGQARTAPFHYNISARIDIARMHGVKLKDVVSERVRWNDRLVAHLAFLNWRWSQSPRFQGLIFKIPRPLLKFYLYLLKGLESF